ncbi:VOC family protein [Kaistia defluvii]|uniref:VOC family protein n=1 Tax=Kaistia defluvii TaxID=410841 RepID=UPI002252AEC6|nr:VOC family protein [Kaistia defluvii]MCX5519593.1 VOC family protein [Kaistia defluvii]
MTGQASRFVWYELMTTDPAGARLFYGSVVGWGTRDASQPGMAYTLFTVGENPVAGLMDLPGQARKAGAPPNWIGYVSVADVDAAAARAASLGGAVHVPPADIPQVGRFAVVSDPQKAVFTLFSPLPMQVPPEDPEPGTPGHIGWHELYAEDWQRAFEFYAAMFGWQKGEPIDMGDMGTYQLFTTANGSMPIGGMFDKPRHMPAPFWLFYFNVDDIDAALTRVDGGGGKRLNGPMQVPDGDWVAQYMDPQGAIFALVGKRA